jgi:2-polyprenyl-3-methyl-5-hydroxy-6-metoxy-1,4-benzoquinol methylase
MEGGQEANMEIRDKETSETETSLRARMGQYSWYHCIEVLPGIETPGVEEFRPIQIPVIEALRELPLAGGRVLDIGCRDGLFSLEAERLGAEEVVGIDNNLSQGAVEFLLPALGSGIRMVAMNLMDLTPSTFGEFDVIVFAGVLYHLRYPFHALRLIRDVMRDGAVMIIETAVYRAHEEVALLHCPVGTDSPYEATSVTFFNLKGLIDTLSSFGIVVESHRYLMNDPQTAPIDRCTLICRFHKSAIDERLRQYWDGLHKTTFGGARVYLENFKEFH